MQRYIIFLSFLTGVLLMNSAQAATLVQDGRSDYQIPVDTLQYEALSKALAVAFAQNLALGVLLSGAAGAGLSAAEMAVFSDFG